MKRLLWTIGVVLSLGLPSFAQGGFGGGQSADDHNDAAPVQVGYAIITPASSAPGLTVMETFGLKSGTQNLQAGFPSPVLTTNATMFVDVSDRLARNVGVALANPNAGAVSVTFTLRRNDGTQLATRTISVPPRNQTAQLVTELVPVQTSGGGFGGQTSSAEYTGTLSITSSIGISVVGIRLRGSNFSTISLTNLGTATALPVISSGIGGASATLLPQFATGGGWETQIAISNSNTSSATVRVDLFKQDGTLMTATLNHTTASSFTNLTVPANGVLVLSPRDSNDDDRF